MIQNQASMGSYPSINMSKPSEQLPKQYIELD